MTTSKWFPTTALILALAAWACALLYNLYFAWFVGLVSLAFYFLGRRSPYHRLNTATLLILMAGDALSLVSVLFLF
jgi:hypothetical protein